MDQKDLHLAFAVNTLFGIQLLLLTEEMVCQAQRGMVW